MKLTKMPKKNSHVARRAWGLLRLALLWARKGGVFKRRLVMELRLVPKFLKGLGNSRGAHHPHDQLHYKEREFSFDETPFFHANSKVHGRSSSMRFLLPCISAEAVDFDRYDLGIDEYDDGDDGSSKSYSTGSDIVEEEEEEEEEECGYEGCDEKNPYLYPYPLEELEGVDYKAEKFIAKFYEQMKLQRQTSDLEYTEMLNRGATY